MPTQSGGAFDKREARPYTLNPEPYSSIICSEIAHSLQSLFPELTNSMHTRSPQPQSSTLNPTPSCMMCGLETFRPTPGTLTLPEYACNPLAL